MAGSLCVSIAAVASPTFVTVPPRAGAASRTWARPRTVRAALAATASGALLLLLLVPVGAVAQIVLSSQLDDRTPTQAIVVLDPAQYWGDPQPVLQARLQHAATLYLQGVAPVIVLTGPARQQGFERGILTGAGVPAADVIAFTTGSDTVGSLQVVAHAMSDLGLSAATVVTDPAAAARAQATASALGIDAHLSPTEAGAGTGLTSEYVARETGALIRFHVLTRWSLTEVVHAR